jgi:hypothetical protein
VGFSLIIIRTVFSLKQCGVLVLFCDNDLIIISDETFQKHYVYAFSLSCVNAVLLVRPSLGFYLFCYASGVQCDVTVSRVCDAVFIVSYAGVFDVHPINTCVNEGFALRMIRSELMGVWRHFH